MTWAENMVDQAEAALDTEYGFGTPVTRAKDGTAIAAIFDPAPQNPPGRFPSESGSQAGFDQPQQPTLWAAPDGVADWEDREILTIDTIDYIISRIDRSDPTLTRLLLRRG
jgi:hypothetical protein